MFGSMDRFNDPFFILGLMRIRKIHTNEMRFRYEMKGLNCPVRKQIEISIRKMQGDVSIRRSKRLLDETNDY